MLPSERNSETDTVTLARSSLTSVLKMALRGVPLRATYRGTLKEDYLSEYGSNLQVESLGSLTNERSLFSTPSQ